MRTFEHLALPISCLLTFYVGKALKALALVRSQKIEEACILCDEVLATRPSDDGILTAMQHVLRGLGRSKFKTSYLCASRLIISVLEDADMIGMFEDAFKQQPENEELGAQTFFANVRTSNWKVAQQVYASAPPRESGCSPLPNIRLLPRCTSNSRRTVTSTGAS